MRFREGHLVSFSVLALVLSSAGAMGQSPGAEPAANKPPVDAPTPPADAAEPPTFYETTTVTARPVESSVGAVTVVAAPELAASAARSGADVLRDVPGIDLVSNGGRAGVTNAWIRGADPNFTLVLLDGVPLNDSTELQGGAVNLEELPAALVERAEVVRGPLTSFYGPNSLSGVVQLFTPRGGPGPRARGGRRRGRRRRPPARVRARVGAGGRWRLVGRCVVRRGDAPDRRRPLPAARRVRDRGPRPGAGDARSALSGRLATGEQDDYPDSSGGPVYGTGETRHTEHDDLALSARLALGADPRASSRSWSASRAANPGPHEPGCRPARPRVGREDDVHAAASRVAAAGRPLDANARSTSACRARASGARTTAL